MLLKATFEASSELELNEIEEDLIYALTNYMKNNIDVSTTIEKYIDSNIIILKVFKLDNQLN